MFETNLVELNDKYKNDYYCQHLMNKYVYLNNNHLMSDDDYIVLEPEVIKEFEDIVLEIAKDYVRIKTGFKFVDNRFVKDEEVFNYRDYRRHNYFDAYQENKEDLALMFAAYYSELNDFFSRRLTVLQYLRFSPVILRAYLKEVASLEQSSPFRELRKINE